jgi:hypothetical protein
MVMALQTPGKTIAAWWRRTVEIWNVYEQDDGEIA